MAQRFASQIVFRAVARSGAAALLVVIGMVGPAEADPIRGAGSTFAAPVIQEWSRDYEAARADGGDFVSPDWQVDYEPVGSLGGLMRLDQPELDFAATDVPVTPAELARQGREQFPIVMGGIAVVVNLDGIAPGALRLDGATLADLYLGRIANWSDPRLRALNPRLALPDLTIELRHRQDGSGSTFAFTEFLSAASADWRDGPGSGTLIDWPAGSGAEGTAALIEAVRATKGAVGYADAGQAGRAGLPVAAIRNRAGDFVIPEPGAIKAAAGTATWTAEDGFSAGLGDAAAPGAYPLALATYAVVPVAGRSEARRRRVHDLFKLGFAEGAEDARALGYVPLPSELVAAIEAAWAKGPATAP